ncbi:MAG: deoxyribonuclease V [Deltaproteobacteria bacterium]|nr:deoxyribonuclease V [Deltaproteobacteria bacterium]
MKVRNLHNWDVTFEEARRIQENLRSQLVLRDDDIPSDIHLIAGADISCSRGEDLFYATVIVLTFPELDIIEQVSLEDRVVFPYIPGLLSFREGPVLLKAFEALRITPDVVVFDGQGIAHPRRLGLASHMGLFLEIPTIGCAKTKLVGAPRHEAGNRIGDYANLILDSDVVGAVVRTKKNVKPLFVSQGHMIGLKRSIGIILASCRGYRLPEPTRQAHLIVNRIRKAAARLPS